MGMIKKFLKKDMHLQENDKKLLINLDQNNKSFEKKLTLK